MEPVTERFLVQIKQVGGWITVHAIPVATSISSAKSAALWDGLGESRYSRYVRVVGPPKLGKNPYSVWAEWKDGSLLKLKGQFSG